MEFIKELFHKCYWKARSHEGDMEYFDFDDFWKENVDEINDAIQAFIRSESDSIYFDGFEQGFQEGRNEKEE